MDAKVLTIRNVSPELYQCIRDLAVRNGRSIQQQVILLLESAKVIGGTSPLERASHMRSRLSNRKLGDTVKEIRQERER